MNYILTPPPGLKFSLSFVLPWRFLYCYIKLTIFFFVIHLILSLWMKKTGLPPLSTETDFVYSEAISTNRNCPLCFTPYLSEFPFFMGVRGWLYFIFLNKSEHIFMYKFWIFFKMCIWISLYVCLTFIIFSLPFSKMNAWFSIQMYIMNLFICEYKGFLLFIFKNNAQKD